jgi:hypothetical protein
MQLNHDFSLLIAGIILIAIGAIGEYVVPALARLFRILIYVGIIVIVVWVLFLIFGNPF